MVSASEQDCWKIIRIGNTFYPGRSYRIGTAFVKVYSDYSFRVMCGNLTTVIHGESMRYTVAGLAAALGGVS
jgi:hypothetical protein